MSDPQPLLAHVVFRFGVGGLENGIVNLINRLPRDRWRHAIVSLTDISREFAERIARPDVRIHCAWQASRSPGARLSATAAPVQDAEAGDRAHPQPCGARGSRARMGRRRAGANSRRARLGHAGSGGYAVAAIASCAGIYRPFVNRYIALSQHLGRLSSVSGRRAGRDDLPDLQRGRHRPIPSG